MKKTNKTFKRFAAITSASLLAACAMAPVFTSMTSYAAENTITITKNDNVAHSYTLYKLFSGKVETATGTTPIQGNIGNPTLGGKIENVAWADGVNVADIKTALSGLTDWTTPTEDTPAAYAKAITTWAVDADKINELAQVLATNSAKLKTVATSDNGTFTCSEDGYYIIVESPVGAVDGSMTCHLLGTYDSAVGAEINVKASKPSVVKKVKENIKTGDWSSDTYGTGFNDVADYSIGDNVPFKLIATLPSDIDIYDKYYIAFTDKLGAGFEKPTSLKVNIGDKTYEVDTDGNADDRNIKATIEEVTTGDEKGWNIKVEVFNVQKYKPSNGTLDAANVTVTYDAKLDSDAVIGRPGNYNDVYLEYSNNPNNTGTGSSNPTDLGKTDKDGVVVFTYQLDIHKYDSADADKALLANAQFVLSNSDGNYLSIDENGDYSWITINPAAEGFKWAESGAQIYTSTAGDEISIPGLDDGTYTLTEIEAPSGFNPITPLELVITATTNNGQNHDAIGPNADTSEPADGKGDGRNGDQLTKIELLNTASTPVTYDTNANGGTIAKGETGHDDFGGKLLTDGNVMVEVANSSGTSLPGTGGIGTTIFYLGGGAMAAIGGIYLISKRRMRKSEE
jgi:fimbrial isopeptide formation D2 family protein/LPXTG-motif cell wall-anchored protein